MTLPQSHSFTGLTSYCSSDSQLYSQYSRIPSDQRRLPLLYEMRSPKELKGPFESGNYLSNQQSPNPSLKTSNYLNIPSERCLPYTSSSMMSEQTMPMIQESNSQHYSPLGQQATKPKIVFSYNRNKNDYGQRAYVQHNSSGACRQQESSQKIMIGEFELSLLKIIKKDKNLKLCSNELNHFIRPQQNYKHLKKATSLSREKYFKTAQPLKRIFKTSGTGFPIAHQEPKKAKQSKIASTEATRSFQADGQVSDPTASYHKEATFDFSSIKSLDQRPNLIKEVSSPEKGLKKTMTLSKYDFGGVINQGTERCSLKDGQLRSDQVHQWKSYVRCLFNQDQDLKQSIHCGPEIRKEEMKFDVLTGFGREIAESCIPDAQNFQ